MIHRLRRTTSVIVSSSQKTVWNTILEFLRYGIDRKMGVILRCKLATHNEYLSKLTYQSVPHFLSYVSANYYLKFELAYSWESYHKNKRVKFYWDTVVINSGEHLIRKQLWKYLTEHWNSGPPGFLTTPTQTISYCEEFSGCNDVLESCDTNGIIHFVRTKFTECKLTDRRVAFKPETEHSYRYSTHT